MGVRSNARTVSKHLTDVANSIDKKLSVVVTKEAKKILHDIKLDWPVRTGRSLAGWNVDSDGFNFIISNGVDYSGYINDGADADKALETFRDGSEELIKELTNELTELIRGSV